MSNLLNGENNLLDLSNLSNVAGPLLDNGGHGLQGERPAEMLAAQGERPAEMLTGSAAPFGAAA
jgi:hypothetical protein